MATNKEPIFLNTILTTSAVVDPGDTTSPITLFTATADGGAINSISVTTDETAGRVISFALKPGGVGSITLGQVSIPAGSGTNGTSPAINALNFIDMPFLQADGSLMLGPLDVITVNSQTTVTTAKQISVAAFGGMYATA